MRQGGRFIADKDGKNPKRIAPQIGSGDGAKPNPQHYEYSSPAKPVAKKNEVK
jgi:hypothetical protein